MSEDEPIELRSDNCAGVADEVLDAVRAANAGSALAYGGDPWTDGLTDLVRQVFEHPTATVFPVSTGTAANAIGLSALCPPWGAILCHETAHIAVNECGASSMFTGGGIIAGLSGAGFRLHAGAVRARLEGAQWGDPHQSQPSVLSLTQPTDYGTLYTLEEMQALAAAARDWKLRVHMDGARIANAIAALGCSAAEITWKAGVDVVSLGATKNGAMSTDAIVCFDAAAAHELRYRTKRAGHVVSKMRYQAAQLTAYLTGGLWLRLAARANAAMSRLAAGITALGIEPVNEAQVNILFLRLPEPVVGRLERAGLLFYRIEPGLIRLVTSFETRTGDVDRALAILRASI
jgi:threonine aldolase